MNEVMDTYSTNKLYIKQLDSVKVDYFSTVVYLLEVCTIQMVKQLDIEQTYTVHSCNGMLEALTFVMSKHYQDIWPPEK